MGRREQPRVGRALVLVLNPVTGDSRVLREAATLRDLGFDVIIGGLVSAEEQQRELHIDGFRVIRLTPVESLKRLLRRHREPAEARLGGKGSNVAPGAGMGARAAGRNRDLVRRLAIAVAYYVQGIALVWRVRPVLVHANDYNTMWVGVAAKVLRRSRLVYDAHELWADRSGRLEWRRWLLACEWLFVRLADRTLTVSPGVAEVMGRRYRVAPPIVVRNLPERTLQAPQQPEGLRAGRPPLAVYVGLLAPGRGLEQAISALAAVPELRLRLMGRSNDEYREGLARLAADAGVADRLDFRPPVPSSAVLETIAGADLGLALIQPICLSYELSLPNKFFEYVAAGLPIVGSDLPVIGALIHEEGLGVPVPPADVEAIAQAMCRLSDPERNAVARERVRSFAQRTTWTQERRVLEGVYRALSHGAEPTDMREVEDRPLTICAIGTGSSVHVATRVRWFADRGHHVFLLTPSPSPTGIEGVVQVELNSESPSFRRAWLLKLQDRLPRLLRGAVYYTLYATAVWRAVHACRPDIVHVYSASDSNGWFASFLGCRPLAVTVMGSEVAPFEEHDDPTTAREWLTLRLLRQADYITPPSDFLTDVLERLGGFRGEMERIIWGVSVERFRRRDPSALRRSLGLGSQARVILSPKILRPFYRIHLLVEAMPVVRRGYPDAVLLLSEYAADPAYREQIARRIDELGLSENIVFSGGVIAEEDMPDYYSLAELSIAIPPKDGMPHALLESMACGTPQILSRLPRYEEIVRHEESAYFVDATSDAIAAGIIRLLEDARLRERIAAEGREIVAREANLDEQAARVEKRFRELVAATPPRTVRLSALLSTFSAAAHLYRNYRLPQRRSRSEPPAVDPPPLR